MCLRGLRVAKYISFIVYIIIIIGCIHVYVHRHVLYTHPSMYEIPLYCICYTIYQQRSIFARTPGRYHSLGYFNTVEIHEFIVVDAFNFLFLYLFPTLGRVSEPMMFMLTIIKIKHISYNSGTN